MNAAAGGVLDIVYPPDCNCLVCGRPLYSGEHTLCEKCAAALEPITGRRCRVCSHPIKAEGMTDGVRIDGLCAGCRRLPLDRRLSGAAPLGHEGAAARLVYALKYNHVKAAAVPLALKMLDALPEGYDALVPVPLFRKRARARGYNQAGVLCDELSRLSGMPVLNALRRARATLQQMRLAADKRDANVKNAFEAIAPVKGMRLIIVDDVRTSGATALACADALFMAGAVDAHSLTATLALTGKDY